MPFSFLFIKCKAKQTATKTALSVLFKICCRFLLYLSKSIFLALYTSSIERKKQISDKCFICYLQSEIFVLYMGRGLSRFCFKRCSR